MRVKIKALVHFDDKMHMDNLNTFSGLLSSALRLSANSILVFMNLIGIKMV